MTADDLRAFASDIAAEFNAGRIPHPIHLSDGNEDALLRVFEDIGTDDWVCGSWRMHSQSLLKGVPPAELKAAIMRGESIALNFPEYRIVSSAIVGGILPIAVGIALGIKRRGGTERVHCFLGDMTGRTGSFHECLAYARNHGLPIRWIIENNRKSVMTPTAEAWGEELSGDWPYYLDDWWDDRGSIVSYVYESRYPHAGAGVRVQF